MVLSLWRRQLRERASASTPPGRVFAGERLVFGQAQHFVTPGDHNGQCKYHMSTRRSSTPQYHVIRRPNLNYCHKQVLHVGEATGRRWRVALLSAPDWHISFVNVRLTFKSDWDLSEPFLSSALLLFYLIDNIPFGHSDLSSTYTPSHHPAASQKLFITERVYRSIDRQQTVPGYQLWWLMMSVYQRLRWGSIKLLNAVKWPMLFPWS